MFLTKDYSDIIRILLIIYYYVMDTPQNVPQAPLKHLSTEIVLMGILSYLGPLVIISYLMKKDDPFVKFHIKQGLVLLSIEVIIWVLSASLFLWTLWPIYRIIHLALFVLSIIGIINATQEKEKELPLVGSLSRYFPI